MIDHPQLRIKPSLPLKSVATALLFSVLLGPVGLLYSSVIGGVQQWDNDAMGPAVQSSLDHPAFIGGDTD